MTPKDEQKLRSIDEFAKVYSSQNVERSLAAMTRGETFPQCYEIDRWILRDVYHILQENRKSICNDE